ncbi:sigma-70 family RNA polymerase sigma factor [Cystobacter fuscus]|uniref:RNA polymerase sigma factor n=1 Tax=Cystobacter fuscus TaxID=43 RepID=UPI002B2C862C|nr:sigma-70 family RNA polymerase sigma factor [Cystobacter fuscus]
MSVEEHPGRYSSTLRSEKTEELARFYAEHRAWSYQLARQFGGGVFDEDDLVSELWTRVAQHLSWWAREPAVARAWMSATFKHLVVDLIRRRRREEEVKKAGLYTGLASGMYSSMSGTDELAQDEYRQAAARVLDQLSPDELELLLDDGRTSPSSSPLDPREANARRVRRHRLRRKLREALDEVGLPRPEDEGHNGH